MELETEQAVSDTTLDRVRTGVWLCAVAAYMLVFVNGVTGGGSDLVVQARAAGAALATAVLGRGLLGILSQARRQVEAPSVAVTMGSLADLLGPTDASSSFENPSQPDVGGDQAARDFITSDRRD